MRLVLRRLWGGCVLNPITLGIAAMLMLLVSAALIADGVEASALHGRVRALPVAGAGSLRSSIGQEVLVEGQVSPRSAGGMGGLAAYVVVERRSRRSDLAQGRYTPPLQLETAAGSLELTNTDYALPYPYRAVALGRQGPNGGQLWAYGVAPGDAVALVGRVVAAGGQPALAAEQIVLGGAGEYRDYLAGRQRNGWQLGAPLLIGALALLGVMAQQIVRYVRHDRALMRQLEQELEQQRLQRALRSRERRDRRRQRAAERAAQQLQGRAERRKQRP